MDIFVYSKQIRICISVVWTLKSKVTHKISLLSWRHCLDIILDLRNHADKARFKAHPEVACTARWESWWSCHVHIIECSIISGSSKVGSRIKASLGFSYGELFVGISSRECRNFTTCQSGSWICIRVNTFLTADTDSVLWCISGLSILQNRCKTSGWNRK